MRGCFFVLLALLCGCEFFGLYEGKEVAEVNTIRIAGTQQVFTEKNINLQVYLGSTNFEVLDAYKSEEFSLCTSDDTYDFSLETDAISYDTEEEFLDIDNIIQDAKEDERISLLIFSLPEGTEDGRAMIITDTFSREFYLELER